MEPVLSVSSLNVKEQRVKMKSVSTYSVCTEGQEAGMETRFGKGSTGDLGKETKR